MRSQDDQPAGLKLLVAILFALVVVFHLANAFAGMPLFRASHLGTALEYSQSPINLFRPVIVGFNANETPTPLELPLWQAAAGFVFKLTGSQWYGWANVVSLLFFATALWPLLQLARVYVGERAAWWALAFFLAQPIVIVAAGQGATDGLSLALTIWFVYFAHQMVRAASILWWFPAVLFGCLSVLLKPPFFMAAGVFTFFLLVLNREKTWRSWTLLASIGAIAGTVFLLWTNYTYSVLAQAEYPFVEMRLAHDANAVRWFFGDLQFRLNPAVWLKGGWRFLHATLGPLPLVALLLAALLHRGQRAPKFWLLAALLTTLVFTSAVLIHWHYYLMFCPAVALLCGATLARWETFFIVEFPRTWLRYSLAGLVLVFSAIDGVIATKISVFYDPFPRRMAAVIREHTKPGDKLIVYCAGSRPWGGEELFGAHRKGLFVALLESPPNAPRIKGLYDLLGNESDLNHLKKLGYNTLVLISESPVLFAVQAVNPGSKRQRFFYPENISPQVNSWPLIYQSEDIQIRKIP